MRHEPAGCRGHRGMLGETPRERLLGGFDCRRLIDPEDRSRGAVVGEGVERRVDERQQKWAPGKRQAGFHAIERRQSLGPSDV